MGVCVRTFLSDETGAITIDWVALTAGILLLGIAVVYAIFGNGVEPLVASINSELKSVEVDASVPGAPDLALADGGYFGAMPFDFSPGTLVYDAEGDFYVARNGDGSISEYGGGVDVRTGVSGTTTVRDGETGDVLGSFDTYVEYDPTDGSNEVIN